MLLFKMAPEVLFKHLSLVWFGLRKVEYEKLDTDSVVGFGVFFLIAGLFT